MVCVHGRGSPGVGVEQHLFALVHVVASDIAQDEDDPEEGHSTQHLHCATGLYSLPLGGRDRWMSVSSRSS